MDSLGCLSVCHRGECAGAPRGVRPHTSRAGAPAGGGGRSLDAAGQTNPRSADPATNRNHDSRFSRGLHAVKRRALTASVLSPQSSDSATVVLGSQQPFRNSRRTPLATETASAAPGKTLGARSRPCERIPNEAEGALEQPEIALRPCRASSEVTIRGHPMAVSRDECGCHGSGVARLRILARRCRAASRPAHHPGCSTG